MLRTVFGVLVCTAAVAAVAYLGLYRSDVIKTSRIATKSAPTPPPSAETAGEAPEPVPPVVTPPRRDPVPARPADASRRPFGRGKQPRPDIDVPRRARNRVTGLSDEELLAKVEEAIRDQDPQNARLYVRDLVQAVKEGRIEADDVADRMIAVLGAGTDPMTLRSVVPHLGYLQNEKMTQFFQEQYWATQDLTTRGMYLNALRQGAVASSVPFLRQVLETEGQQTLRNQALYALSKVSNQEAMRTLEDIVRTGSGVDQITALQLISNRGDATYVPLLEEALLKPEGSKIRETAIRGLQQVGTASSISVLETIRDNPDVEQRVRKLAGSAIQAIERRLNRGRDAPPTPPGDR